MCLVHTGAGGTANDRGPFFVNTGTARERYIKQVSNALTRQVGIFVSVVLY